ncbi:DoxX family protein [Psychroserpens sp. BH13MA-6]
MFKNQEYLEQWSFGQKLWFRFTATYFSLYICLTFTASLFEVPFRWIASTCLGINYAYDVSGYGSGDHTYAYVTLFMNVLLTGMLVIIWTVLDRKRQSYNRLFYWFLVLLRVVLIFTMCFYGAVKIFQIQFPQPSLVRLLEPLGNYSPMGLAWTYMGYSEGFNMFTGFMEVLGALLLIPRRTQTLGAFIVMGVMTHVAIMNFMFDIPVKLMSSHLVGMAAVIFFTDIRRFVNVFIQNQPTKAINYFYPVKHKTYHKSIIWLKAIVLSVFTVLICVFGYQSERERGHKRQKPLLYGIWETSNFIKNGDTLPPLVTDDERWRYFISDYKDIATVKFMDDQKENYHFTIDSITNLIKLYPIKSEIGFSNFTYDNSNPDILTLEGILEQDTLQIIMRRKDLNSFELKSRGFHWINERPYNR